jgi:hypothetical protein
LTPDMIEQATSVYRWHMGRWVGARNADHVVCRD